MENFITLPEHKLEEMIEQAAERGAHKALQLNHSPWVNKEMAMRLLDCKQTKLRQLVNDGKIRTTGKLKTGKPQQYHHADILAHLSGGTQH